MIRRPTADGTHWQLISQVEHARLAGEIAETWTPAVFERLGSRDEIVEAIFHHDDGWTAWEQTPGVEPKSGAPRNFTEMPVGESLDIWRRSIDAAAAIGPLAALMVSGHFSALLRRSNAWQPTQPPASPEATVFVAEQDEKSRAWLQTWRALDPVKHTESAATEAMHWLQFFDALSLWLCCAPRSEPHFMVRPDGGQLRLTPGTTGTIGLAAWPLTVDSLRLETPVLQIPAAKYGSAAELATAPSQEIRLGWTLCPAGD